MTNPKSPSKLLQKKFNTLIALLACASVSSCSLSGPDNNSNGSLSITFLPSSNPSLIKKKFERYKTYLEAKLQKKIIFNIPSTYAALRKIISSGNYEIAQINPVLYAIDYNPKSMEAFATELEGGETSYRSVFIVKPKSKFWSINDLNGKIIGMNNKLSTSGYVIPTYILKIAGLKPNIDYQSYLLGSHANSIRAVIDGKVDVSAVSWPSLKILIENNIIKGEDIRIIETSMRIPNDVWIMRKTLKESEKSRIRDVFYSVQSKEGDNYLGVDGFVPVNNDDYAIVNIALKDINE